ncbi:MAG: TIGR03557 family F420-dependent LLM class oxidoreductase [Actinobacteria bacterium]|nr:TIGR03557 family F420-dependent LLM class oxidoreductase [Actinomycetota bacterium]
MSDPSGASGIELGWWLSSEEHDPRRLVDLGVRAEHAGLGVAMISDHLQPWTRHQGQSPHVWTVLGALARETESLRLGTGVTAMVHRNDPIDVAHAAATVAIMSENRFFLGVGTGERLNEQPFGRRWPASSERRDRMAEAIEVIRRLWAGDVVNHRGTYWNVEGLRLATRPAVPPPIHVAATGRLSATVAGESADGLIGVTADQKIVEVFRGTGGEGKPCTAQLHVSLAATADDAFANAWEWWPNAVVPPPLLGELARPEHFEATSQAVGPADIERTVTCATDAGPIVAAIDRLVGAGFGTVLLHQVGPDQDRLLRLCETELLPHYAAVSART